MKKRTRPSARRDRGAKRVTPLSPRLVRAFRLAARLHAGQGRKGTEVPYLAHLMGVASLVLEAGGDEGLAIAALLHDAVEDCGGPPTLRLIRRQFGRRVARVVEECTDADTMPKPPWRERKERYLAHLPRASADGRLVSAADKLHNARAILIDYRLVGEAVWERFKGGREGTLWYYRSLVETFRRAGTNRVVEELARTVEELERAISSKR